VWAICQKYAPLVALRIARQCTWFTWRVLSYFYLVFLSPEQQWCVRMKFVVMLTFHRWCLFMLLSKQTLLCALRRSLSMPCFETIKLQKQEPPWLIKMGRTKVTTSSTLDQWRVTNVNVAQADQKQKKAEETKLDCRNSLCVHRMLCLLGAPPAFRHCPATAVWGIFVASTWAAENWGWKSKRNYKSQVVILNAAVKINLWKKNAQTACVAFLSWPYSCFCFIV